MLKELAGAVRDGRTTPLELVEESLRRIEASQDTLNAVVALRADEAREEAARHPRTGPLAGLPLLVKDMARCRGMRTTMGSPLFADAPPDEFDDVVVTRLREAGAIVLGRTNTPAFGHAAFTTNQLFGTTRNPWNPERSPGGSSGGSAAALAAALVPLATTSDGGGSVRIPASCCGLVGYKPSMGAIGRNVLPRWIGFSTQGATGTHGGRRRAGGLRHGRPRPRRLAVTPSVRRAARAGTPGARGRLPQPARRGRSGHRGRVRRSAGHARRRRVRRRADRRALGQFGRGRLVRDRLRRAGPEPGGRPRPVGQLRALVAVRADLR